MTQVRARLIGSSFYSQVRFELHAADDGTSPGLTCVWLEPLCWLC